MGCRGFLIDLGGISFLTSADPKYEEEVSGCTASTSIISKNKIWVVCGRKDPVLVR